MTQSGLLTRSSKTGVLQQCQCLRFEDKKGEEQLWLHAEKDQLTEVEHDEDKWVGNDRARRSTATRPTTSSATAPRRWTATRRSMCTGGARKRWIGDETITILKGKDISVDGSGKINIKASGDVAIKGSKIASN
jgi:type VI secretion system secreted protein VgrG